MTVSLSTRELGKALVTRFPTAVIETSDEAVVIARDSLYKVAEFLRYDDEYAFNYLNYLTAIDYYDYFEIVYQITSLKYNHTTIIKTRCNRDDPSVPSVTKLWRGADFQERETFDLLGIIFEGHPNLKRIVLWEGFQGYPLRKDYLQHGETTN
jgi:NADH/F420H2 dehydrogenase subunit C